MGRKYVTEVAVQMTCSMMVLLQEENLRNFGQLIPEQMPPFHIYAVCRRPRVSVDPAKWTFGVEVVTGHFLVHQAADVASIDFEVPQFQPPLTEIRTSWPNTTLELVDATGAVASGGKAALLATQVGPAGEHELGLEVLYVGQAYGAAGRREAPARLESHSTFQRILGEAVRRSPDREIWIVLMAFQGELVLHADPAVAAETSDAVNEQHIDTVLRTPITAQQKINFTEAALIRYFRPEYNETFKDTFPSPAHSSYRSCYDLDLNMVILQVESTSICSCLWTENVKAAWIHLAKFPLHDTNARMEMLRVLPST
jgi:hypothetical protein